MSGAATLDVLIAARRLIEKPEHWARNNYWAIGDDACDNANKATRFCLAGALTKVNGAHWSVANVRGAAEVLAAAGGQLYLECVNLMGHAFVIETLDRAIEAERAKATGVTS